MKKLTLKSTSIALVSLFGASAFAGTISPPVEGVPPSVCAETTSYTLGGSYEGNLVTLSNARMERNRCRFTSGSEAERNTCEETYQDILGDVLNSEFQEPIGGRSGALSWGNSTSNNIVIYETKLTPCA